MKISNEGMFKRCPICGGKQELYCYCPESDYEEDIELLENYWCCHRCGFTEYQSEVTKDEV